MSSDDEQALAYHRADPPGKLTIVPTKPLANQRDLSLAYSPGVAAASRAIVADPAAAAEVTGRANLVAVVTNGTAVLGLGNIGPLAAKPVMEGKAVLFRKFAGIDAIDIEVKADTAEHMVEVVAALEPSFGAINLEDIKAPECFAVEGALRRRMAIPVFHDDQHGTAIVVAAAVRNALELAGKRIEDVKLVSTGGGAAGIACLTLLVELGLRRENIVLVDHLGVVFHGRTEDLTPQKAAYAVDTPDRTLAEAIRGADVFLGLSVPNLLDAAMLHDMADRPVILALANPTPEVDPDLARSVRPDAIIATGRSDQPNQVNNVLCFPFIFRGALDVGATTINEAMKIACVDAIAGLARQAQSEVVARAYGGRQDVFGPAYVIPKPFDPRLILEIAPAVARAAMDSGVATRPIADMNAYRARLGQFVFRSGLIMKPVVDEARAGPRQRVVFAEGEQERVLHAAQAVLEEGVATPILVGRPSVISHRLERLGLPLTVGRDFDVVNPEEDARYADYWMTYHGLMERRGVSPDQAKTVVRTNTTAIAALMVRKGDADAMLCGTYGQFQWHLRHVRDVIGLRDGVLGTYALSLLILPSGSFFLCDTYVNADPTVDQIVEMTMLAVDQISRFGVRPKVALLSHSNFGNSDAPSAAKMAAALQRLHRRAPDLEVEGEMHADAALDEQIRERIFPNSRLSGQANLLVMPNLDASNIAFNMVKVLADGLAVGPMLLGIDQPAHILTPSATARGLFNMAAMVALEAQRRAV